MVYRKNTKSIKRFLPLDSLRGIAALGVVLSHYTYLYDKYYGYEFTYLNFKLGGRGVELFFILSGFVIFYTIENVKSGKEFLIRRFIRLYPTYWACLTITFVTVAIFGLDGLEVSTVDAIIGLSMVQQIFKVPPVDRSYWTLIPEFFFYISIFLLAITHQIKNINLYGIILLCLSFVHIHLYHIKYLGLLFNLDYICYFFAGIVFYQIKTGKKSIIYWILISLCCFVAISSKDDPALIIAIILIYLIFSLFSIGRLDFLTWKPLLLLGNISYAWYLLHQNIGYVIINLLKPYFSSMLIIIPPILITLGIAILVTYWIEKPIMKYLKMKLLKTNKSDLLKVTTLP